MQELQGDSMLSSIRIVSLNCWGLKYISKYRQERLREIGLQLAAATPRPQIVGLQECWTQEDYLTIRAITKDILPHGKFYHSGFFGAGLVILSAWPIEESSMYAYPLNGRPAAFFRGDWYVGKGVASARIRIGPGPKDIIEVFCTHLHAPYEAEHKDSYTCHRTAQAWEIAKLMRHAAECGHMVVGLGDFNMLPTSLAHQIIEARSPTRDVWQVVRGDHSAKDDPTGKPSVRDCIEIHGATCDSALNTWRWSKQMRKDLKKGREPSIDMSQPDPTAQRLDYIFHYGGQDDNFQWRPTEARVGMMSRHPNLKVSLSDHFSIEVTLAREPIAVKTRRASITSPLPMQVYDQIITMITSYTERERRQRFWQLLHFIVSIAASIACLGAIFATARTWVAFILAFVSTLVLSTGLLDGLMGGLFVKQELRALKEFLWEVECAQRFDRSRTT